MSDLSNLRVLVVDQHVPTPQQDTGSVRMIALLQMLLEITAGVTFVASFSTALLPVATEEGDDYRRIAKMGVQIAGWPDTGPVGHYLAQHGRQFDVVLLSGGVYAAAKHMDQIREHAPQARLLYDTVDLKYLREFREARLRGHLRLLQEALAAKRAEQYAVSLAHCTLAISPLEQAILQSECPDARVEVVPTIHEAPGSSSGFAQRAGLFFIGSFAHSPNADAMVYYCSEIHPLLRRQLPGVKLHIVGHEPPPEVQALASEDIIIAGYVPDLTRLYNESRVFIAPLRFGAGVKGKVLASMGMGLPAVVTPVAAEGIPAQKDQEMLVAASPADFAAAVYHAYTDAELWQRLAVNGVRFVSDNYSYGAIKQRLAAILERLVAA